MFRSVQRALERVQRVMRVFSEVKKNHKSVLSPHNRLRFKLPKTAWHLMSMIVQYIRGILKE